MIREMYSPQIKHARCQHMPPVGERLLLKLPLQYLYALSEKVPIMDREASGEGRVDGVFAK